MNLPRIQAAIVKALRSDFPWVNKSHYDQVIYKSSKSEIRDVSNSPETRDVKPMPGTVCLVVIIRYLIRWAYPDVRNRHNFYVEAYKKLDHEYIVWMKENKDTW